METPVLLETIHHMTLDMEEANRILAAGGAPEDCMEKNVLKFTAIGAKWLQERESVTSWGSSLCTAAEWERHTRLRAACVQLLRTVGPQVDWASPSYPAVGALFNAGRVLASALAALHYSGAADALSSQPPEQQASFFRQWQNEAAVVSQLLNAIADAPSAALSSHEMPAHQTFDGVPFGTVIAYVLMDCLRQQDALLPGFFQACSVKEQPGCVHCGASFSGNSSSGASGGGSSGSSSGDSGSSGQAGGSSGGGSSSSRVQASGSSFITCEQEFSECVQLSERLVRLLIKLQCLQAAMPAGNAFASGPVVPAFDLPHVIAKIARDWAEQHLTPETAQHQLPAVLRYAAATSKALRAAEAGALPASTHTSNAICSLHSGLLESMWLVEMVLKKHPHVAKGKRHLTQYLRTTGLLVFECIPALQQSIVVINSNGWFWSPKLKLSIHFLRTMETTGLMDEAVRGGMGPLLQTMFDTIRARQYHGEDAQMLRECARLCTAPQTASLALAVGAQGLLAAAVGQCRHISQAGQLRDEHAGVLMASTGALLRAVCSVLDSSGSTSLATDHAQLLSGFCDVHVVHSGICDCATGAAISVRSTTPLTWAAVQASLLPAIEAASREQMAAAQAGEAAGMDRVFRDVAVSPWTCTNPGCTNLAGCSEAQLHFMTCGGCGEARYCCKECQRSDWRRHKVACRILKESKASRA